MGFVLNIASLELWMNLEFIANYLVVRMFNLYIKCNLFWIIFCVKLAFKAEFKVIYQCQHQIALV